MERGPVVRGHRAPEINHKPLKVPEVVKADKDWAQHLARLKQMPNIGAAEGMVLDGRGVALQESPFERRGRGIAPRRA